MMRCYNEEVISPRRNKSTVSLFIIAAHEMIGPLFAVSSAVTVGRQNKKIRHSSDAEL